MEGEGREDNSPISPMLSHQRAEMKEKAVLAFHEHMYKTGSLKIRILVC